MMQTLFKKIYAHGLANWAVVLQGMIGIHKNLGQLPPSCVQFFANSELEKITLNDERIEQIVALSIDSYMPSSERRFLIEKINGNRTMDMLHAQKVWRVAELEKTLQEVDSDPIYGLIKLSEFWSNWGWPSDAPPSMHSEENSLSEREYHSAEHYKNSLQEHQEWLKNELTFLKNFSR